MNELKKNTERIRILGVAIDRISRQQAKERIDQYLRSTASHAIFTPNPEMLVEAAHDAYFREILSSADLTLCDGFGLRLASLLRLQRISGADFVHDIFEVADREGKGVFLLGTGNASVLEQARRNILTAHKGLRVVGTHVGPIISTGKNHGRIINVIDESENERLIDDIIDVAPEVLVVGFGHPKQEKWIYENLKYLPSVRIAIGVGGTLDYISGHVSRAPKFFRALGLEWLYRVFRQPRRIVRIIRAVFVFPLLCLMYKLGIYKIDS
ncbi:WecB/TagA/CpsF family glycosyltransferase [Candidatus Nomurabacteria bacterium]|nr:WecB/TagA/CpsF family glycosyltransferase [Candidatus Nomurabacteria bacterium]